MTGIIPSIALRIIYQYILHRIILCGSRLPFYRFSPNPVTLECTLYKPTRLDIGVQIML